MSALLVQQSWWKLLYKEGFDIKKEVILLDKIKKAYVDILKEKLTGIYIHGSIALGCFNWDKSDIDFIVVVNSPLSLDDKEAICNSLNHLQSEAPKNGLEMSIILKSYCINFEYPTPFELHFSNGCIDWYRSNPNEFCLKMNGVDKDLAAHFTIIRKAGQTLYGEEIEKIFGDVDKKYYIDSILNDISDAKTNIQEKPTYYILNLCRVLGYLKEELVLSKRDGGKWGMKNLPKQFNRLINVAHNEYTNPTDSEYDQMLSLEFAEYILTEISTFKIP